MTGRALVIGAGIGGLAAGVALARRGWSVRIVEQAPVLAEVGAGLQVSPNGLAVLEALGVVPALERSGAVAARAVELRDHRAGRLVARLDLGRLDGQRYFFVHRADLVAALRAAADTAGVAVDLGRRVGAVVPGPEPEVVFDDGACAGADLVVCADGLHTVGRAVVDGVSVPRFTGQVAWRATVPARDSAPVATVTMGPGRHVVSYPLRGGRLMNLVAVEERAEWAAEGWQHEDDPAHLRAAFADFGGPVAEALARVGRVHLWGLFRHPVAGCWARDGVALLGDAAHPSLPFLAQGANMALEDAWVLAEVASGDGPLARYQDLRRARCARIVAAAAGNARKYHLRHGPLRWGAHLGLSLASRVAPGAMIGAFDWLYRHDVTASGRA